MKRFILRTYGLLINSKNEILLTQEKYKGVTFTKFPGGGVELGEGIKEALSREFSEEAQLPIEVKDHFYTTDCFVASAFNPEEQLISVYYFVDSSHWEKVPTVALGVFPKGDKSELFTWVPLRELTPDQVTFPIDKKVVKGILERFC